MIFYSNLYSNFKCQFCRYSSQLGQIHEWLKQRAGNSLHLHQLKSLIRIFKKMYKDFELQGILNCRQDPWKSIQQRLTVSKRFLYTFVYPKIQFFPKNVNKIYLGGRSYSVSYNWTTW